MIDELPDERQLAMFSWRAGVKRVGSTLARFFRHERGSAPEYPAHFVIAVFSMIAGYRLLPNSLRSRLFSQSLPTIFREAFSPKANHRWVNIVGTCLGVPLMLGGSSYIVWLLARLVRSLLPGQEKREDG